MVIAFLFLLLWSCRKVWKKPRQLVAHGNGLIILIEFSYVSHTDKRRGSEYIEPRFYFSLPLSQCKQNGLRVWTTKNKSFPANEFMAINWDTYGHNKFWGQISCLLRIDEMWISISNCNRDWNKHNQQHTENFTRQLHSTWHVISHSIQKHTQTSYGLTTFRNLTVLRLEIDTSIRSSTYPNLIYVFNRDTTEHLFATTTKSIEQNNLYLCFFFRIVSSR